MDRLDRPEQLDGGGLSHASAALVCVVLASTIANAAPDVYEPGSDPALGVILISWWNFGESGATVWEDAVEDVFGHGFRSVSICPVRFVDPATGDIRLSDGATTGPDVSHIAAALARARALGMAVTLNPFVEPDGFASWRGELNFTGAEADRFFRDYEAYLLELAAIAETHEVARMTLGTELRALVRDASHDARFAALIAAVSGSFGGALGYAANWDNYRDANLTATIWEHPDVDFIGVDAYQPLATRAQASGAGDPAVATLEAAWTSVLETGSPALHHAILPFAAARKQGAGMPVVLTEHGTIPYDETTFLPFSAIAAANPPDPAEQRNDYDALVRAADDRGAAPVSLGRLAEIHIWHWGMPGSSGSLWLLDPEGDDVTEGALAARRLVEIVSAPEAPPLPGRAAAALALAVLASGAHRSVRRGTA